MEIVRVLWIVAHCGGLSLWSFYDGHIPCEGTQYEIFDSSPDAMRFINGHEGSFNLIQAHSVKEKEFRTVYNSSTTFSCEWPRGKKP